MSIIGSTGSSDLRQYQLYTQLNQSSTSPASTCAAASSDPKSTASEQDDSSADGASPLSALRSQIESAVTSALDGLGPTASASDVVKSVGAAIQQTLQANGIDPQQLQGVQRGHGHRHHGRHGPPADSTGSSGGAGQTAADGSQQDLLAALLSGGDGSGDSGSDAAGTQNDVLSALLGSTGTDGSNQQNPLASLLSFGAGNGSDPSSAITSLLTSGTGDANSNVLSVLQTLFKGFPNGSGVNLLA